MASGNITPWERLRIVLAPERGDLWVVLIYGLAISLLSLVVPVTVQAVVNTAAFGSLLQPLFILSVIVLALLTIAGVLRVLQLGVAEVIQQRLFARMAIDVAHRLPRVRIETFDRFRGADLVNRFMDVMTVQKTTVLLLLDGFTLVLQAAIGLAVLGFYSPVLLGFDVLLLAGMAFVLFVLGRGAVRTSVVESYAKYSVVGWLEELARIPLAFKTTDAVELALRRADTATAEYIDARKAHFRVLRRQIIGSLTIQALASGLLLGLGGWLVAKEQLTLGQLVAAELIVTPVMASFAKLGKHLESFYDLLAAVDKVGALFDLPLEDAGGQATLPSLAGPVALRVRRLQLRHENRTLPTLENLDLLVEAGERVALVGPHGSGKSSLLDVVLGLRRAEAGTVELGGIDARDLATHVLRRDVALVRGRYVFDGTVLENIRAGRDVPIARVNEVLQIVRLEEEIADFPDGLSTRLSGDQSVLSAGQALRLMWARALLGRPRLLLVDEALDELTEDVRAGVTAALFSADRPVSVLIITKLGTIVERCDRVVTLGGTGSGRVER